MRKLDDAEQIAIGKKARALLGDELFDKVLTAVITDQIRGLLSVEPGTPEAMKHHCLMKAVDSIKSHLGAIAANGEKIEKESARRSR